MTRRDADRIKVGDRVSYFQAVGTVVGIIQKDDYQGRDGDRISFPLFQVKDQASSKVSLITYKHHGLNVHAGGLYLNR